MKEKYILFSSLLACICLYIVEQYLGVSYIIKTLIKILLFGGLPFIYMKFTRRVKAAEELNFSQFGKKQLKLGLIFGLISFFVIFIAFFIFKGTINFNDIVSNLRDKNITPANFIFIGLYITFGNSFLEEFFFRGFIFLNLYNIKRVKLAYTYSSLLFGLYHIAIFKTWFSLWMIMLCLLGLIVIGFVFDWLDTKSDNFINSWIVHILADSAIILIGLRMFEII